MKALVTGAGGFLGRYIVEQLVEQGHHVRAYSRRRYEELDALGVQSWQGDLRDPKATMAACAGMDVAFHVAGVAGIWGPWDHFYGVNVLGTQHVVAGCHQHSVPKLVYTSSPSVTFDGTDQRNVDESAPYPARWLCFYPRTKAMAERIVLRTHGQNGLATCALRPHLIWGPRDTHLIPRVIQRARKGRLRRVGKGKNLVDTVFVTNAAMAHLQAADALTVDSPVGGKAYFISQGEPVNCWEWINEILLTACISPIRKSISAKRAWAIGHACELVYRTLGLGAEPPMTRFLAAQLSSNHYFDISAAKRDFGYSPEVSQAEGMDRLERFLRSTR